jgi:hypothetical protein
VESLPSLFDLPRGSYAGVIMAVATYVAGPLHPGGVESWDLTLLADGYQELSSDPFSFAGEFLHQGLQTVRVHLLGPAGFIIPSQWPCNEARTEFHVPIQWMARRQTEFW